MKKSDLEQIMAWFDTAIPNAESELMYHSPYELLVAVILSAQCTDKRVNITTPALFSRFPDVQSMASAGEEELYDLVKSISYPHSKTLHLLAMARKVVEDFGGEIPSDFEALQTLPGVGRKTANVMMAVAFNKAAMPVDTHVFRVANRIGLAKGETPLEVEKQLVALFPTEKLSRAHHWLILHGRYTCNARKPHCELCGLTEWCKWYKHHQQ